jgi:hypothetical protein
MGWLGWLLGGVRAVSNFFDSLYNRLPSSVRGLIFGFSVVVTVVLFIFFFRVRARINCYLDLGDSTRSRIMKYTPNQKSFTSPLFYPSTHKNYVDTMESIKY